MELQVKRLTKTARLPERGTPHSVGYDLCADTPDKDLYLNAGGMLRVSTGLALRPPGGFFVRIMPRSGLAYKHQIMTMGGVIDPDYTGECFVMLYNAGHNVFTIEHGMRIAQGVLLHCCTADVVEVETMLPTKRGSNGFGSTGL